MEESMRIEKDNIVIRSATIDDAIQLNKWWNDGKVKAHIGEWGTANDVKKELNY